MPDKVIISHCEMLDKKPGNKLMDEIVPFTCTKCPFDSYLEKNNTYEKVRRIFKKAQ